MAYAVERTSMERSPATLREIRELRSGDYALSFRVAGMRVELTVRGAAFYAALDDVCQEEFGIGYQANALSRTQYDMVRQVAAWRLVRHVASGLGSATPE